MSNSDNYEALNQALVKAGVPAEIVKPVKGCDLKIKGAVNVLVNSRLDAAPYARLLLDYAPRLTVANEIEMAARCMTRSKGFGAAVPWLLSLFHGYPNNGLNLTHLWAIGNAIYTINNKKFYADVVLICSNDRYGSARQMLMGTLARAKSDQAYEILIESSKDQSIRAHAIAALGRFGRTDAIPLIESLEVQKGLYEYKAKNTALRRLRRLASKSD